MAAPYATRIATPTWLEDAAHTSTCSCTQPSHAMARQGAGESPGLAGSRSVWHAGQPD